MGVADLLFGRPLATCEDGAEKVGAAEGVPIYGLDALGSAAYGPEAALTVLIPLGALGVGYALPIVAGVSALLAIVYCSYRQTIAAYPSGGGSYTVARFNLGARLGLLAAAALMIDYLLNVAVGISTGVGALISAAPSLQPHTLALCLGILAAITLVNLRGLREAGLLFMAPSYLFVVCLLGAIAWGLVQTFLAGGHPTPVAAPAKLHAAAAGFSVWLLVKAFSSGCTAMTGVEAVSNGTQSFREPVVQTAQRTLTLIVSLLIAMLLGVAYLVRAYGVGATEPGGAGYQSLLSQLLAAVEGKGVLYYVSIGSILVVLCLSANTSFAAFPRLCRTVAQHGYLPYGFAARGRRLVYYYGILALALCAGLLLIAFGGITDRLIPLFAIGAFLSFTLSQAGMVMHWRKNKGPRSGGKLAINAVGAVATGITTAVVLVAKFGEGAWITLVMIPALLLLMGAIRKHYHRVELEVASPSALDTEDLQEPLVVVPVEEWNRVAKRAMRFALTMSQEVQAIHIDSGEDTATLRNQWEDWVCTPARKQNHPGPRLVVLDSPYRFVVNPIAGHIFELEKSNPGRQVAVVISELVERHWFQAVLHNQRARMLQWRLTREGERRIVVVNVPWYFDRQGTEGERGR